MLTVRRAIMALIGGLVMPKAKTVTGPRGEVRPADPNKNALRIVQIATGETAEEVREAASKETVILDKPTR